MATDVKQIARRFMDECWNQGKLESIRELVSDNCRIHDPVFPSLTSGADNLKRHIGMCKTGFPDLMFSIDDTVAEGNEVVLHWTARGTHKAEFLGMPATNRNATVSGTSIFRIDGDKIAEQWSDWNLMSLMEQLGVGMAPSVERQARTSSGEPARASSSEPSRA
jgi:steroid delta-isomerase-like uncharacterized protein